MHRFLLHNDEIRDAAENIVSPGQVGLLNGWGVFSTIRVYDGVIFEWARHWARMKHDAARVRVPFPANAEALERQLYRLIDSNEAVNATLRVVVIRNRGGMWQGPSATREFDVVAFTADVNQWGDGVRLGMAADARFAAGEFAGTKYLSWSENLVRYERAHENGFDEVVLLNERGEIAECTSANLFTVEGSQVWTPPLSAGCLPGVTRALLLEIPIDGLKIGEKTLFPADLESADEVFLTSTTRELLPVYSVEGLSIRRAQSVMDRCRAAFSDYASQYLAVHRRPAGLTAK